MMSRTVALLSLVITVMAVDAGVSLRPFGVNQDLAWEPAADVDPMIARMAEAGVQAVRMDFRWYMIEPANGHWAFGVHDQIVAKLRARGIEVLGLLSHPPPWANGGGTGTVPPLDDADWRDFVQHVADHYKGLVGSWEIWNEENLPQFFSPQPDAARYVRLLKDACDAIRTADPGATVVLGGLGGNGVNMGWETPESRYFLQKIYDNGGKGSFDVVAIHPYVHPVTVGISGLRTFVGDTRNVMTANGDAGKPIWLTEIGWSTAPDAWSQPTVTEAQVATWVQSVYAEPSGVGAEKIFWHNLRDMGSDPLNVEHNFGLLRRDLSAKPAYRAYFSLAAFSDPVLTPGVTLIRVVHVTELRGRIDGLRARAGLAPFAWTDSVLGAGTTQISARHILDLRAAVSQVYVARGVPPPTFTDVGLPPGTPVKVQHIVQLRGATAAIE